MSIEQSIEIFAAINFLILGLSHVIQHEAWAEFSRKFIIPGMVLILIAAFLGWGLWPT